MKKFQIEVNGKKVFTLPESISTPDGERYAREVDERSSSPDFTKDIEGILS